MSLWTHAGLPSLELDLVSSDPDMAKNSLKKIDALKEPVKQKLANNLRRHLRNRDVNIRIATAEALGRIGPPAKASVPALLNALNHESETDIYYFNFDLRRSVVLAIGKIGKGALPALLQALKHNDSWVRCGAAIGLSHVNPALAEKKGVPAIRPFLRDKSLAVRRGVVWTLGEMGPSAKSAVPNLMHMSKQARRGPGRSEPSTRKQAYEFLRAEIAEAIGGIGAAAAQAIPLLIDDLRPALFGLAGGDQSDVYIYAAEGLEKIGQPSVPFLVAELTGLEPEMRKRVTHVLGRIGPDAKAALPALEKALLADPLKAVWLKEEGAQEAYLQAIGKIDPDRKEIVMVRLEATLVKRSEEDIIFSILESDANLDKIKTGKDTVPAYVNALNHPTPKVRRRAARALAKMGPVARGAVPTLVQTLFDQDDSVRKESAIALKSIGVDAAEAVPYLIHSMFAINADVRLESVLAIAEMGTASEQAIPYLIRATKDKDERVRRTVADTLVSLGLRYPGEFDAAIKEIKEESLSFGE